MLRGIITLINGQARDRVAGDHGPYRATGASLTPPPPAAGGNPCGSNGCSDDYAARQVAFAPREARRSHGSGCRLTSNILGARHRSGTRRAARGSFENAGIGFVLTVAKRARAGAPHTHIATATPRRRPEAAIPARTWQQRDPTSQRSRRARRASTASAEALRSLAAGAIISYGAGATLVTGFIVLIGAAAAGERGRVFEPR